MVEGPTSSSSFPGEYDNLQPVRTAFFNGEKTPYEMGDVLNVLPDYNSLRLRSYEANLKSDVVKIITNKFFKWIIGSGLKLQSEPVLPVLVTEGITTDDLTNFKNSVESRYNLWAKSKHTDFIGQNNLHVQANNLFETTFLGGDALVILRVENGNLNVQIIDGQQVQTPYFDNEHRRAAETRGNVIKNGIEKDKRGRHVAFFIRVVKEGSLLGGFERIPVFGKLTNRKMAWMVYFKKHRIDHDRGIGALPAVLEKIEKLDRYTEAAVGSAEERAKLLYYIKHNRDSTGENPLQKKMMRSLGGGENVDLDSYAEGEKQAKNITQTTSKQVYNLPIGADIGSPSVGSVQIEYPEFWRAVFNSIAAAVDIPPEVALQMYNSNYSASRAAINGWQHLMNVTRQKFSDDFYKPIYEMWLEIEVLKSKVSAPGYLKAIQQKNWFALEAYSNARFTGANIPHIDPKKEADAIRLMLGTDLAHVPLINLEQATERMNAGDWNENHKKHLEEQKQIPKKDVTEQNQNRK